MEKHSLSLVQFWLGSWLVLQVHLVFLSPNRSLVEPDEFVGAGSESREFSEQPIMNLIFQRTSYEQGAEIDKVTN